MAARFIQLLCSLCMLHFFGSLHGATGEVHEGVVYTDQHKTAKKGDEIVLKCKFYETPIGVYWKKRDAQDRGTNLITWVEGEEMSGSCANSKACHMSSNYSLVIREARIEDQGRYTCRVSINVGILIYNYTDVKIYAPPKEPYPFIDKCAEKESSGYNSTYPCRILTNTTIILTCSATNYYPELDLVFLHGSQKVTDMLPSEKMNSDETKNKSISIKASPSETSYVCVASGIPGSKDPRAATILVESSTVIVTTRAKEGFPTPFTSIAVMTDKRSDNRAAKIGVPIFLIILIGTVVLFVAFLWWKHPRLFRRTPTDDCETGKNSAETSNPEERIPMVEPETIAGSNSATTSDAEERIPMVEKATISGSKSATTRDPDERIPMVEKATNAGSNSATLVDPEDKNQKVEQATIAGELSFYELWILADETPLGDSKKVHHVLGHLGIEDVQGRLAKKSIYDLLCEWKDNHKKDDHAQQHLKEALLKEGLDRMWIQMCQRRENSNTSVSDQMLEHILWHISGNEEMGRFLQNLTSNDSATCLDISRQKKDIIKDAMEHLVKWKQQSFDENPIALLSLALEKTGCSPVDRLCVTVPLERMTSITESEVKEWVDRVMSIHARTLEQCLDIDKDTMNVINDANKDTILNMEEMVNDWIRDTELSNYVKRNKLNETPSKNDHQDVTSANDDSHWSECMENAFQRVATYLSASQLDTIFGGHDDPLKRIRAYAKDWESSHPNQDLREHLRKRLNSIRLKDLIPCRLGSKVYLCELLEVAFRLLLDDLSPFAMVLGISYEKLTKYRVQYAPDHLTKGTTAALIKFSKDHDDNRKEVCETLSNAGYKNIAQLLEFGHETSLADDLAVASKARGKEAYTRISKNLKISPRGNIMAVLKDWKATVHPPSYNQRTSLADAVFPVLRKDVAVPILTREYRGVGQDSSKIIKTISTTIEEMLGKKDSVVQDERLTTSSQASKLLGESAETGTDNCRQDVEPATALTISKILGVSIADSSIRQVLETWEEIIREKPIRKCDRKELSDKLLRAGFKQFALEIMTGFLSRPGNKPNRA